MTLEEFYRTAYLPEWVLKRNRTIRNKTIAFEKYILPMFGLRELDSLKKLDWVRFENYLRKGKGLESKTIKNHQGDLRHIMNKAVDWEYLNHFPKIDLVDVVLPDPRPLAPDVLKALLAANILSSPHIAAMFTLDLATGMRVGELRGLQWGDFETEINPETGAAIEIVHIRRSVPGRENAIGPTKNGKSRKIPLNRDALLAKQKIYAGQKSFVFVFSNPDKPYVPLTYKAADYAIKLIAKRAGVDAIGWHALRHTVCSIMLANNVSIFKVRDVMGHVDIRTTLRYAKIMCGDLASAVATLDHLK